MEKLNFEPRTLDEDIVKDGLCAAGALEDSLESRGLSFVVGGVATQSYLPTVYRRPTSDIDLAVLRPLNYSQFRDFSKPAQEFLQDNGYTIVTNKGHIASQVIFSKDGEAAVLEFPRRSSANYERRGERLEREKQHSRKKLVEGRGTTFSVASPEDIAVPKIVRGVGTLSRNPEFCRYIQAGKPLVLSRDDIGAEFERIQEMREEAILHVGNPELAERLRFVSDLFDVRALSEVAGFNDKYLAEAIDSWDKLQEKTESSRLLVNYLLPEMS